MCCDECGAVAPGSGRGAFLQGWTMLRFCLGFMLIAALSAGCVGPTWSTVSISSAQTALDEAKAAGAESSAPYEYTMAVEMLRKASEEWGYSDFGIARQLADQAKDFAERAKKKSLQSPWMGPPSTGSVPLQ